MTHATSEASLTSDTTGGRVLRGLAWTLLGAVTLLEVLAMGDAGLGKFKSLEDGCTGSRASAIRPGCLSSSERSNSSAPGC